jgi:hypothetical protein
VKNQAKLFQSPQKAVGSVLSPDSIDSHTNPSVAETFKKILDSANAFMLKRN